MVKTLQKHGNSHALVIDRALMEQMGIDADSPLQVVVSGNTLIVTPTQVGIGREAIDREIDALRPRYGETLKRLAE